MVGKYLIGKIIIYFFNWYFLYLIVLIFFCKVDNFENRLIIVFKLSLFVMFFKEVDGKFFFEFDKDCFLKCIFFIVNMFEYEYVCVFKSFINSGGVG